MIDVRLRSLEIAKDVLGATSIEALLAGADRIQEWLGVSSEKIASVGRLESALRDAPTEDIDSSDVALADVAQVTEAMPGNAALPAPIRVDPNAAVRPELRALADRILARLRPVHGFKGRVGEVFSVSSSAVSQWRRVPEKHVPRFVEMFRQEFMALTLNEKVGPTEAAKPAGKLPKNPGYERLEKAMSGGKRLVATSAPTGEPVRKASQANPAPTGRWNRNCLSCGVAFQATSAFIRMCPNHTRGRE